MMKRSIRRKTLRFFSSASVEYLTTISDPSKSINFSRGQSLNTRNFPSSLELFIARAKAASVITIDQGENLKVMFSSPDVESRSTAAVICKEIGKMINRKW